MPIEDIIKIKQEITMNSSETNATQATKKKENNVNKNKNNQQKNEKDG